VRSIVLQFSNFQTSCNSICFTSVRGVLTESATEYSIVRQLSLFCKVTVNCKLGITLKVMFKVTVKTASRRSDDKKPYSLSRPYAMQVLSNCDKRPTQEGSECRHSLLQIVRFRWNSFSLVAISLGLSWPRILVVHSDRCTKSSEQIETLRSIKYLHDQSKPRLVASRTFNWKFFSIIRS
jgi:hypothetical protein